MTTLREQLIKQGFLFFVSLLRTMQIIDNLLTDWDYLAAGRPAIADFACYSYVAFAPEGRIPLAPAIQR